MRLILSRHGNTFSPGEKAVWVGRRSDLPLVEEGRRQAVRLGAELQGAGVAPAAIYCGPLLRTTHYAQLVAERFGNFIAPIADEALTEIDYGDWEGLTSHEIVERFGGNALKAWESRSIWPTSAGWLPPEAELARRIEAFVCGLAHAHTEADTVLAVTSNGILRYFLRLDCDAFSAQAQARAIKVATGNICIMDAHEGSHRVITWNATPEAKLFRSALCSGAEGM
jgi:broad specificity phosphatase PhoE